MPYQHRNPFNLAAIKRGCAIQYLLLNIDLLVFFFILFQKADERRGVFNRLSHFFSSKRKKNSSKRHSNSDTNVPSPPLSPCSVQSEEDEELNTPTPSRKECNILVPHLAPTDPEHFETLSQSSDHSTSSTVSIVTCNENSTNIIPRTLNLAIKPCLDSCPGEAFLESRVQDKCQQSSVDPSSTEVSTEHKTVNQTVLLEAKVPFSTVIATPTVPKPPSSNASAFENQDNFNPREAVLQSPAFDLTQQDNKTCPDAQKENAGTNKREQECIPGTNGSLQLHEAIQVETYLREVDKDKEEGDNLKSITKDWQEGLQADMPLVLAIPVRVIPEDCDTKGTTDSPPDTSPSMEYLQLPGSSQNFHTTLLQTHGSSTCNESKPSTLQEKHASAEVCVTRKTVNLPSKHRVMPPKIHGNQVQRSVLEKPTKEENRELHSKMLKTTKLQL